MGVEDGEYHKQSEQASDSSVTKLGGEQCAPVQGVVGRTVVDVADLERRLAEAEAALEKRRQSNRESFRRWRTNNLEEARRRTRESVRASRARKRGTGS
jgi:hypothetical protein